jgi:putative glutathione S-transferase
MTEDTHKHTDGSKQWSSKDGRFRRQESTFRDSISRDKNAKFPAALNRYHLVTAMACPWAHRAMIVRQLKGLDKVPGLLPLHTVDSLLGDEGWSFTPYDDPPNLGVPGTGNKIPGHESKKRIREFYKEADPVSLDRKGGECC